MAPALTVVGTGIAILGGNVGVPTSNSKSRQRSSKTLARVEVQCSSIFNSKAWGKSLGDNA